MHRGAEMKMQQSCLHPARRVGKINLPYSIICDGGGKMAKQDDDLEFLEVNELLEVNEMLEVFEVPEEEAESAALPDKDEDRPDERIEKKGVLSKLKNINKKYLIIGAGAAALLLIFVIMIVWINIFRNKNAVDAFYEDTAGQETQSEVQTNAMAGVDCGWKQKMTVMVSEETTAGENVVDEPETPAVDYTVDTEILHKVEEVNSQNEQEDSQRGKQQQSPPSKEVVTMPPTAPAPTVPAPTVPAQIKEVIRFQTENGAIVYRIVGSELRELSKQEVTAYTEAEVLLLENGNHTVYKGCIYAVGNFTVTEGDREVITKFLVREPETNKAVYDVGAEGTPVDADVQEPQMESYRLLTLEPVTYTMSVPKEGWDTIGDKRYYYENYQAVTGWKKIGGYQYYFNEKGQLSSVFVIDVSRFNGDIDWRAVKAAGIDCAIIRVGYRGYETGKLVIDPKFHENMQGAESAGIQVGAYVVTQAVNTAEAVEEASFIVEACRGYHISLPLVIDVESAGGGAGRGDKISAEMRTRVINAYANTILGAGYVPMVYANQNWMTYYINMDDIHPSCRVWIARYADHLGYTGRYNMWQFTSTAVVNGLNGYVDVNAWIR